MNFIYFLLIGIVAGWLAGKIMKGSGFGLIGNLAVGVLGSMIGGFLASFLGLFAGNLIGSIVVATLGAVILLYLIGMLKKS
jgi:uncharacterized membrane protein YeaQ/YmgE (transglycosylase-associated protein family)